MMQKFGIKPLKLDMKVGDQPFVVHAALLWDDQDVILIDAGIPGQLELIREAMTQQHSIKLENLTKIIITHQDRDHIGSLPELVQVLNGVQVAAHEAGVPYLAGEVPLIKSGAYATPTKVDIVLKDGDVLPYCGGIRVIHTPGHSPDHISLYHVPSKTLISGDALTSEDGVLKSFDPRFTPDQESAWASIRKLADYEIDTAITYHGGVCSDRVSERLREIVENAVVEG